ncbi:MAG: 4-(cytidine 5'-diphospho)-2-C-methyl-D-erythritol kinase [Oscillospiraceae bacterium]|jgi:4-diphosphocytidyl-2-C-methyl-D-erythritol kinase|nr:4-(cytidine 5'-diphospho)-2-C-methyl-D-erythritol kinase [Oscillospiraceae bacterium]
MDTTTEKAFAKLNLSLDVGAKRPDGYHEMTTVCQTVDFCDELTLTLRRGGESSVSVNLPYLPCDRRNIALKAAALFFEHIGESAFSVHIDILKHIPVCAGLGGGSADAAAVLRALNSLTKSGLTPAALETLSEALGSDVPFCVRGGTALSTGRGEILTPLPPLKPCSITLCKPRFSVSTPTLFARLDKARLRFRPDTEGLITAIKAGDLPGCARRIFNIFEEILPSGRDQVDIIKSVLLEYGALGAAMSGTGSAVFGVFEAPDAAKAASDSLSHLYREVFLTAPQPRIEE